MIVAVGTDGLEILCVDGVIQDRNIVLSSSSVVEDIKRARHFAGVSNLLSSSSETQPRGKELDDLMAEEIENEKPHSCRRRVKSRTVKESEMVAV